MGALQLSRGQRNNVSRCIRQACVPFSGMTLKSDSKSTSIVGSVPLKASTKALPEPAAAPGAETCIIKASQPEVFFFHFDGLSLLASTAGSSSGKFRAPQQFSMRECILAPCVLVIHALAVGSKTKSVYSGHFTEGITSAHAKAKVAVCLGARDRTC